MKLQLCAGQTVITNKHSSLHNLLKCNDFGFSAALVCLLLDSPLRQSDMSVLKSMKLLISFQNEAEGKKTKKELVVRDQNIFWNIHQRLFNIVL